MPPQARDQAAPDPRGATRAERRISGREQRKLAAEQAARRKQYALVGGAVAVALVVALVLILMNRPREAGPLMLAAQPLPETIPTESNVMGQSDAPVTVVEWGDYT
jgi:hypothetical protein